MAAERKIVRETCEHLARLYIDLSFAAVHPEILADFPEYPLNVPASLKYKRPAQKREKKKDPEPKRELAKRETRFKGKYINSPELEIEDEFLPVKSAAAASEIQKEVKSTTCLSESSSDSSDSESDHESVISVQRSGVNLSDSSEDENMREQPPKVSEKVPETLKPKTKVAKPIIKHKTPKKDFKVFEKTPVSRNNSSGSAKIKKKVVNKKQQLGGIFTMKNGWDLGEQPDQNENPPQAAKPIQKIREPPDQNENPPQAAKPMQKIREPPQIIENNPLIQSFDFDDEDYSEYASGVAKFHPQAVVSDEKKEIPPQKYLRMEACPSEDENSCQSEDGSVLEIHANDCLDLFESPNENLHTEITSELDGLVLYTRPVKPPEKPVEKVMQLEDVVDPQTAFVLKTVFGNACPIFLERPCENKKCPWRHELIHIAHVSRVLLNASVDHVKEILRVAYRFQHLFINYCHAFAELFVIRKSKAGIIELIKGCDRYESTIKCYFTVYNCVVQSKFFTPREAVELIITYHKDSPLARNVILQLIISTGPEIVHFLNYLENISLKGIITRDIFDKILDLCVNYQRPSLLDTILNVLLTATTEFRNSLNQENIARFVSLQREIERSAGNNLHNKLNAIINMLKP